MQRLTLSNLFILSGACVVLLGCQPPPPAVVVDPTLESIQAKVFDVSCATGGCHDSTSAMAGLDLSAGNAFNQMVNIPSTQNLQLNLVQPASPDTSYLIKKLEGTMVVGAQMPKGQPALPQAHIDAIRWWIQTL